VGKDATIEAAAPRRPSVSVVIPVFNGAATVGEVVARSREALAGRASRVEFVLVNDGSADDSWERIAELAAAGTDVRGIDLSRNYGQHNALLAGIRAARCDLVVTIDDDLQNPPEEIPKLLAALGDDCDVVYGEPIVKRQRIGRRVATRLVVGALSVLGGRTAPMVSSFRIFRTELRDGFAGYGGPDVSIDGLLTWQTERFRSVPVRHDERQHGESNYSLVKLVRHALTMITAFSTRPLRLATTVGFLVIVFGLGVLLYVLIRVFTEGSGVPGFPFLASIVSIFSGAQLFSIGVIGEYLARMHVRVMARPSYSIRSRVEGRRDPRPPAQAGDMVAEEPCRVLSWDSEFWGLTIARVVPERLSPESAQEVARWCGEHGVDCAFLLADAADDATAAAALAVGFVPVDTRVTLERAPRPDVLSEPGLSPEIRPARETDRAALERIARGAHTDTRFYFDPRFSRERAGEMYVRWVLRGFEDDSRLTLVATLGELAIGYLLLKREPVAIELIAVEDESRGKGIGRALVEAAVRQAPDAPVSVVTQARNVAALRLYESRGFRLTRTETWFHRWA